MSTHPIDIAIVGGGLAGGLTALAIRRTHPSLSLALIEAADRLGGNHRWSWFENDLSPEGTSLLSDFVKMSWSDNEVRFPDHKRRLAAGYRSLDSREFDAVLRRSLPGDAIRTGCRAFSLDKGGVVLESGERLSAQSVIDCRAAGPSEHLTGGWQVFLGQHLKTSSAHGVERPVIMDATVTQHGAYRFVYLLPLSRTDIFVEDTYYADGANLDEPALARRIADYASQRGWEANCLHEETGVLPVITGGDFDAYRASLSTDGVALAGARGGFVHPLTSYTMPIAVENALEIARMATLPGPQLASLLDQRARNHWRQTGFYRMLGKMLFAAAEPEERYRIFQRFYRLNEPLIERFYAARSTPADKIRILSGKPPVPIASAIGALLGKGRPLVHESRR